MNDYNTMSYPHSQHRRFVRGCEECLQRTKAAQARYTESKRRTRMARTPTHPQGVCWACHRPYNTHMEGCTHGR